MRLPVIFPVFVLLLATTACGVEPQAACTAEDEPEAVCDESGYFPLCEEPEANEAVEEAAGLFCSWNPEDEPGREYIGPELERGECTDEGELATCPNGEPPTCYYLPNCDEGDI